MDAKEGSPNFAKFVEKYGRDVYELEAVPPQTLQQWLQEAIDSVMDLDAFNAELEAEKRDAARLQDLREQVKEALCYMDFEEESDDSEGFPEA